MHIAIISDIHANLPALESVLEDIERQGVDGIYCLGDLVGYAPWPNEVVDLVRSLRIPTIAGNYDVGVGACSDDCGCAYKNDGERERGALSIRYTNAIVTESTRRYLHGLPRQMRIAFGEGGAPPVMLLVHGSPRRVNEYLFEDRADASFERMMLQAGADILLFGHTHTPFHRVIASGRDGGVRNLHAINTGSVGKPKDGDPRACYAVLELDPRSDDPLASLEFVRVAYDVERAARAIEESILPDAFATMLRQAR